MLNLFQHPERQTCGGAGGHTGSGNKFRMTSVKFRMTSFWRGWRWEEWTAIAASPSAPRNDRNAVSGEPVEPLFPSPVALRRAQCERQFAQTDSRTQ